MMLQHYLLNPTDDDRLRKPAVPPEVWHYVLTMEWLTQSQFSGFALPAEWMLGYDGSRTPRAFALEAHAQFTMQIIDKQGGFQRWFNNYADAPGDQTFANALYQGATVKVGRDRKCFVVQAWLNGYCIGAARCDRKAPPPPGWRA